MLNVFFDIRSLVHNEFVPEGQAGNKEYYLIVLKRLYEKIREKRLNLWKKNSSILHDDNVHSVPETKIATPGYKFLLDRSQPPTYQPECT